MQKDGDHPSEIGRDTNGVDEEQPVEVRLLTFYGRNRMRLLVATWKAKEGGGTSGLQKLR